MDKLLSVIVPSYNMEKYLPKCLGSLVGGEKFGGLEALRFGSTPPSLHPSKPPNLHSLDVIVVNDGSTDRTSEIAHDFERRYPGVFRVIDKPNGHYGSCINAALPLAVGKYVKVLDADDWFDTAGLKAFLLNILHLLEEGRRPDLIVSPFVMCDSGQSRIIRYELPERQVLGFEDLNVAFEKQPAKMHAFAYLRDVFSRFDYHQLEGVSYTDNEWIFMPMAFVRTAVYFDIPLYCYLLGRVGQSMDPAVRVRDVRMVIGVVNDMMNWYLPRLGQISTEQGKCLRIQMQRTMCSLYALVLFGAPILSIDKMLRDTDSLYLQVDEASYAAMMSFTIFQNTPCPFDYLAFWRRHRKLGCICIFAVRLYSNVRHLTYCRQ